MNTKLLNPKKVALLFLTGFIAGLVCVSMGWAKAPAASKKAPMAKKITLKTYVNPNGPYQISYPAGWAVNIRGHQLIARSSGVNGGRGIFGIMRRTDKISNDDAVAKEFEAKNRPHDLVQMPARVAGMQAIKVIGTSKDDPDSKMVEYYVQNWDGQQYYILMVAPRDDWKRFNVAFNAMLNSLSLN